MRSETGSWLLGMFTGICLSFIVWVIHDKAQPSAEEAARNYHATRACIERSSCRMTVQNWIDYYELKYELEEKEIE
jgi:hypothetical protein